MSDSPEDRLREFRARAAGVRNTAALDAAAVEVFSRLNAEGVDALLLKGPALTRTLYRPGEARGYSDVDIIVGPADLSRARRVLESLGYVDVSDRLGIEDVAGVIHDETWIDRDAEPGRMVDLHSWLPGVGLTPDDAWPILVDHRVSIELLDGHVPVLDHEGLALHLALHAAQHGAVHAKGLADLRRGVERWDVQIWRGAADLARSLDAVPAFSTGLRQVPEGAALAGTLALERAPDLEWDLENRADRPRGTFHLQALAEARGVRARARLMRGALLPHRRWIAYAYPWSQRSRSAFIVARAWHLLRAPAWASRAAVYKLRARR